LRKPSVERFRLLRVAPPFQFDAAANSASTRTLVPISSTAVRATQYSHERADAARHPHRHRARRDTVRLEWTEIIIIFVPIFLPMLKHFNIDPILWGTWCS
jgi:hypothetical protein